MTSQRSRIIICGQDYELAGDVKCITFKDPGGYNFYADSDYSGDLTKRLVYDRRKKSGEKIRTLSDLQEKVRQVVIHTDCTESSSICYRVLVHRGLSTHFLIDWDGTIYQAADVRDKAIHGGAVNGVSVGIDMNNRLPLFKPGEKIRSYKSIYNGRHPQQFQDPAFKRQLTEFQQIQLGTFRSYSYTDAQYTALIELLKILSVHLPGLSNYQEGGIPQPPVDESGAVLTRAMDDPVGWHGLLGHYHVSAGKIDPGPWFDWDRIFHALRGEDNFFPVDLAGATGRSTLTRNQMRDAAEAFYQNVEMGDGGYFPVGVNQQWHGGIHVRVPRETEVRAMLTGKLVAARMRPPTALGSPNFVLLKHQLPMPKAGDDPDNPTKLHLYSLYMHLENEDLGGGDSMPRWMQEGIKRGQGEGAGEDGGLGRGAVDEESRGLGTSSDEMRPYVRVGLGTAALERGDVALFEGEGTESILIPSGEIIGRVGEFGKGLDRDSMVHVEFFADNRWREAIDLSLHGEFFVELGEDTSNSLQVKDENILGFMGGNRQARIGRRGFLFPEQNVAKSSIQRFYGDEEEGSGKEFFRKAIARHVSEWSDQVDWLRSLSDAQEWEEVVRDLEELLRNDENRYREGIFSSEIRDILPFIWLTQEVAEGIGLEIEEWNGVVYHFHPIHFLEWLSFHSSNRVRVISRGKTRKELLRDLEKTRKRLEKQRLNEESGVDQGPEGEELLDESLMVEEVLKGYNPSEKLDKLRRIRVPGKWRWDYKRED